MDGGGGEQVEMELEVQVEGEVEVEVEVDIIQMMGVATAVTVIAHVDLEIPATVEAKRAYIGTGGAKGMLNLSSSIAARSLL